MHWWHIILCKGCTLPSEVVGNTSEVISGKGWTLPGEVVGDNILHLYMLFSLLLCILGRGGG